MNPENLAIHITVPENITSMRKHGFIFPNSYFRKRKIKTSLALRTSEEPKGEDEFVYFGNPDTMIPYLSFGVRSEGKYKSWDDAMQISDNMGLPASKCLTIPKFSLLVYDRKRIIESPDSSARYMFRDTLLEIKHKGPWKFENGLMFILINDEELTAEEARVKMLGIIKRL